EVVEQADVGDVAGDDAVAAGPDRLVNGVQVQRDDAGGAALGQPGHEPVAHLAVGAGDQDGARHGAVGPPNAYGTGHGSAFQIPSAYSRMVRSAENFPEKAMLRIAFFAHSSGRRYRLATSACALAYGGRSARCM